MTRINKYYPQYPIGYIVDLSYPLGRPEIGYVLLETALQTMEKVNVVNFLTLKNHPDISLLSRFGFLDSRIDLHVEYELYTDEDTLQFIEQTLSSKIQLSWGDYDILPVKMPKIN